jgi:serine protease inhibitor
MLFLHNCARGQTQAEIESVLELKGLGRKELNSAIRTLREELNSIRNLELVLANSIWVWEKAELLCEFEKDATTHLGADVERADFHSEETLKRINSWMGLSPHFHLCAPFVLRLSREENTE